MPMLATFVVKQKDHEREEKKDHPILVAKPRASVSMGELCEKVMKRFSKTLAYLAK